MTSTNSFRWWAPFDPDVIHHQEQLPQVSLALMMRFRSRALQVLMVHDPLPHSSAIYALAPHTLAFLLRLRAFADLILVHGPANEEQLRRASPELAVPVKHVQHGVVLVPPPAMLGAPVPNSILMFGWLQEHKGMDVLLEACALLETARTTYSLTIAGSGPEPARLARQVASLRNVTVLEGFQPPDIAIALMQNASLVALPYRDATQSGVLASAFANGRPVVATRTGDIPRLVTDGGNGLLIPPQDPRGLAEAITRIFTTPGFIERLAAGAARTAMTEMNWDTISEDLSEAYFQGRARKAAGPDTSLAR